MAQLNENTRVNKGKKRCIRKSTNVDLTPMVDLGFLLITFFVFTSAMTKPSAMNMVVPNDKDTTETPVCESCALTILMGKDNTVFYYEGRDTAYNKTNYSPEGIRHLIEHKKQLLYAKDSAKQFQLIIKPSSGSTFKNLIDVIDEAAICSVKRYYITGLSERDKAKTE